MTSVHVHLYEGDGTTGATGYVLATPTTRRDLSAGGVALPVGTAYTLVGGEATMTLAPTGLTWCWEIREMTAGGTTRYISVVDSATTLEYEDCADVDPTTLVEWSPANPEASYLAALAALELDDLADVDTTGVTDGQALVYDAATDTWGPGTAGAVTSVDGQTGAVSLSSTYEPLKGADDNYVTDAQLAALHSHANKTALDQVSGINTGDQTLPTWSTISGKPAVVAAGATQADARTSIGAAPTVAPTLTAVTPAPVLSANLAPALGSWTLAGGATWDGISLTIPAGGTASCFIAGFTADQVVQFDLTRTSGSGGGLTLAVGAASATYSNSTTVGTVVTAASGTLTCTIGGGTYAAVLTAITIRTLTRLTPAVVPGAAEMRAWGSDIGIGTDAQYSLTTGSSDIGIGTDAQRSLTTGSYDIGIGTDAQRSLTTGSYDIGIGTYAQYSLTTGSSDIGIGTDAQSAPAGQSAWATTTASRQTSIGHESGQGSATQSDDIVTVGYRALADGTGAVSLGSGANAAYAGSVALGMSTTTTATAQVAVGARDVEIQDSSKGVVLKSPDGTRYRITVANGGTLNVAAA